MQIETQIAIIGSGVAGIQAALYSSRRKMKTLILGRIESSSLYNSGIANYFGFYDKQSGTELLELSKSHAKTFDVEFREKDVIGVEKEEDSFTLTLEDNTLIKAKAVIIATGISRKKLHVKGEKDYLGKGVSYCVDCDAMFFRKRNVVITGDGSSAIDAVYTLSKIVNKVYFVLDNLEFNESFDNVEVIRRGKITEIAGDGNSVKKIILEDKTELEVDGIFIELGAKGAFELFQKFGIELDKKTLRHIEVDAKQMTNIDGVFAAGDITGAPYQVAVAAGEGTKAGIYASEYVKGR
ncbi:MAG: FAD-dependent oxidoreductase [bacterium]|nr:FAD-dependent oxidoreductase [bacterium]